ncbi:MAG: hypothetical protein EAY65_03880 [Alphaproteobacteria bacterium]|nr:MAG: hypothetical protein EAY65_03880 [Alphaproteobacteria bacterium]
MNISTTNLAELKNILSQDNEITKEEISDLIDAFPDIQGTSTTRKIEDFLDCSNHEESSMIGFLLRGFEESNAPQVAMLSEFLNVKKQEGIIQGEWEIVGNGLLLVMEQADASTLSKHIQRLQNISPSSPSRFPS